MTTEDLINQFKKYVELNYSNEKTRELYLSTIRKFWKQYPNADALSQDMLDNYIIWLNKNKISNPYYRAFIKAVRECYDPDENLKLKVRLDKSRELKKIDKYKFLTIDKIYEIINKTSPYISLTVRLMFETGLRKELELLKFDLNDKNCGLDLINRRIEGIGKGNQEYNQKFSEITAKLLYDWLHVCRDPTRPFLIFKKTGIPYKNQGFEYWKRLRKETEFLNIKTDEGDPVSPHCIRHSILHHLKQNLNQDLLDVQLFARHKDPKTTARYAKPKMEKIENMIDSELFGIKNNEKEVKNNG